MFDLKSAHTTERLTDAVDLIIDFATLGEYGLEPVGTPAPRPCEGRLRIANRRSTGTWNAAVARFSYPS